MAKVTNGHLLLSAVLVASGCELVQQPPRRQRRPAGQESAGEDVAFRWDAGGPRFGLVLVTGSLADTLETEYGVGPVLTVLGWQFELQYRTSEEGPVGIVDFVPMLVGLDQGLPIPSLNVLSGLRMPEGLEFGFGANLGPGSGTAGVGVGFIFFVGHTFRPSGMNIPLDLAVVTNKDGVRVSITFGWNVQL